MNKEQAFQSFVTIGLEQYNNLVFKNKAQEELIDLQAEEFVQVEASKEFFQKAFYEAMLVMTLKEQNYGLREVVQNKDDTYWNRQIFGFLNQLCEDKEQQEIVYNMALEKIKKQLEEQGEQNGD